MITILENLDNTINLNDVYKVLKSHNIDKYSSNFKYNKDQGTITFDITIGKNKVNKYPVGTYNVFDNNNVITMYFWSPDNNSFPEEYVFTLQEFDEEMKGLYRYCSKFYTY